MTAFVDAHRGHFQETGAPQETGPIGHTRQAQSEAAHHRQPAALPIAA
jgi:hypothetical protein